MNLFFNLLKEQNEFCLLSCLAPEWKWGWRWHRLKVDSFKGQATKHTTATANLYPLVSAFSVKPEDKPKEKVIPCLAKNRWILPAEAKFSNSLDREAAEELMKGAIDSCFSQHYSFLKGPVSPHMSGTPVGWKWFMIIIINYYYKWKEKPRPLFLLHVH